MLAVASRTQTNSRYVVAVLGSMLMLCGSNVYAQQPNSIYDEPVYDPDPIKLFNDGLEAVSGDQYEKAARLFAESYSLSPSGGTALNLGICYARSGKRLLAWSALQDALVHAARDRRQDRELKAHEELNELNAAFPLVILSVDASTAALRDVKVFIDGLQILEEHWRVGIPIELGRHVVTVSAMGHKNFEEIEPVQANARIVTVMIPPLEPMPLETRAKPDDERRNIERSDASPPRPRFTPPSRRTVSEVATGSRRPPTVRQSSESVSEFWSEPRIAGASLSAIGLLGLATAFGLSQKADSLRAQRLVCCGNSTSSEQGRALDTDASAFEEARNGALVAGGVVTAAGLGFLLLSPAPPATAVKSSATRPPTVSFAISPRGAAVIGTF